MNNPKIPIKSIAPLRPIASNMPSKVVSPIGAPVQKDTLASLRSGGGLPALPPIGDAKAKDTGSRDTWASSKLSATLSASWSDMGKFMPSSLVNRSGKKFNSSYVSGFSSYADFFGGLTADFGAGELKEYQTTTGKQNLYEYQYQNFLRYGDINGPKTSSEFSFRDGRWWTATKPRASYEKIVSDSTDSLSKEFGFTAQEDEAFYQLALKNRLNASQYAELRNVALSRKYSTSMTSLLDSSGKQGQSYADAAAKLKPYIRSIETGAKYYETGADSGGRYKPLVIDNVGGGISTMARYGSIFDPHGDPGIGFLGQMTKDMEALSGSLKAQYSPVAGAAAAAATYYLAPALGLAASIPGIGVVLAAAYALVTGIGALVDSSDAHRNYDLVNNNGRAIDNYGMITSEGDKKGIDAIAGASGLSRDQTASILGALYRYRVLKAMQPALDAYNSQRALYSATNEKYNSLYKAFSSLPSGSSLSF